MRDPNAAVRALAGADVVIALAYAHELRNTHDGTQRHLALMLNTLDAARRGGARRVIVASSNQVMSGHYEKPPYAAILGGQYDGLPPGAFPLLGVDDPVWPTSFYGLAKVLTEQAAQWYSEQFGLSTICLRIGTVTRRDRPLKQG